jgi:hypothetical protein
MRSLQTALVGLLATITVFSDTGFTPRPDPSDYQAHQETKGGTIAASVLSPGQVAKIFSRDVSRKYAVVEVAVYPRTGQTVEISAVDFMLKTNAEERSLPASPGEVAGIRRTQQPSGPGLPVHVVAEAGVGYGTRTNPVTGQREHGWDTYSAVGVDNRPQPDPRPSTSNSGPWILEGKLRSLELPEGQTSRPVAGYLYFPVRRIKNNKMDISLEYSTRDDRAILAFPAK